MTQRNCRGAYVTFEHDRAADWDWLAKWQPNVIRYMAPGNHNDPNSFGVQRVKRIHDTCPDATILLRCWDVDDRNFEAHDAMVADPVGEAARQVDWWAKVFDRCVDAGIPRERLMAGLNNETGPEKDAWLYPYTERALQEATPRKVRLGVFVFSVGRPALAGESNMGIPFFEKLAPLILQNNGAIILHSYMQPEGMYAVWTDKEGVERHDWTYLMGRDTRWPTSVPIIIGEWGIDGIIYNRHPDKKYGNSGWTNFKEWPPSRYADEYVECIRQANPNVIAICPFISDWSDHKWQSFDLIEAYGEFLARKDLCVREVTDTPPAPATTGPTGPTTPLYVNNAKGANLRESPNTDAAVLQAIPYGHRVDSFGTEITQGAVWNHVIASNSEEGWIFGALLSPTAPSNPGPTPPVKPTEPAPDLAAILDPRVIEAILQVESSGSGFGADRKPTIRFEVHIFKSQLQDDARWSQHFFADAAKPWTNQQWRTDPGGAWQMIHTGHQADEYAAFEFAKRLNADAAYNSISMGAPQIMGFNHAGIGYPSAAAMYAAFARSGGAQFLAMLNYMLRDPALLAAIKSKDWEGIARGYNGSGNVEEASAKYKAAYESLGG